MISHTPSQPFSDSVTGFSCIDLPSWFFIVTKQNLFNALPMWKNARSFVETVVWSFQIRNILQRGVSHSTNRERSHTSMLNQCAEKICGDYKSQNVPIDNARHGKPCPEFYFHKQLLRTLPHEKANYSNNSCDQYPSVKKQFFKKK